MEEKEEEKRMDDLQGMTERGTSERVDDLYGRNDRMGG